MHSSAQPVHISERIRYTLVIIYGLQDLQEKYRRVLEERAHVELGHLDILLGGLHQAADARLARDQVALVLQFLLGDRHRRGLPRG